MKPLQRPATPRREPALAARRLMRTALKASLATLDRETGHPYASLVLVATEPDGTPVFLISRLALHTRNLEQGPARQPADRRHGRARRSPDRRPADADGRGAAERQPHRAVAASWRAIPRAEGYAGFADFSVYALEVAGGHYIGGFGRIVDLPPRGAADGHGRRHALIEAEPDIVAHMNSDHADAVALYATELAGCAAGRLGA